MKERVAVGLSGGVDSAVAAMLLLEQGYDVVGVFMRNWHDESVTVNNECPWIDDSNDAMMAAEHLGIPFTVLDFSEAYRERIVEYMFREYASGRTPNPDVLCNREIKFDLFLKAARELKADYMATGHYCRKAITTVDGMTTFRLLSGMDKSKDQSYFLCQINQNQLQKALFPIGHLQKSKVRALAREAGLPNADKRDSQGLCFVGKVKLPTFLQQKLVPKEGDVIEIKLASPTLTQNSGTRLRWQRDDGHVIGRHSGAHFYTIGQRKGLRIGGHFEPLFVLDTDTVNNLIYVGEGENHPGLSASEIFIESPDVHFLRTDHILSVGAEQRYDVRIRYRQALTSAILRMEATGLRMFFQTPQRGVAPGQFAAWYDGDELIGSGVISA